MQGASREEGRKYVDGLLKKYPVVMFGRSSCPACVSAKTLLNQYDTKNNTADHKQKTVHHVFLDDLKGSLQYSVSTHLQLSTGRKASPFIYIGGNFIGNNVDVRALATKRTLGQTIKQASEQIAKV